MTHNYDSYSGSSAQLQIASLPCNQSTQYSLPLTFGNTGLFPNMEIISKYGNNIQI